MLSPWTWLPGRRLLAVALISFVAQAPVNAIQLDINSKSASVGFVFSGLSG